MMATRSEALTLCLFCSSQVAQHLLKASALLH